MIDDLDQSVIAEGDGETVEFSLGGALRGRPLVRVELGSRGQIPRDIVEAFRTGRPLAR